VLDAANTSQAILADKGYVDGKREARLASAGWRMFIQRKGGKDKSLSETQEKRNRPSPGIVHASSTCLSVSRRWDRKRCAASDWRARRCI
jgi:IS5 family transposase